MRKRGTLPYENKPHIAAGKTLRGPWMAMYKSSILGVLIMSGGPTPAEAWRNLVNDYHIEPWCTIYSMR